MKALRLHPPITVNSARIDRVIGVGVNGETVNFRAWCNKYTE
jgi:hypothetical protein